MSKFQPIPQEQFNEVLNFITKNEKLDKDYLYRVYKYVVDGIDDISESNTIGVIQGINHVELISYIIGEYSYFTFGFDAEKLKQFQSDENIIVSISSVVADKYLSLEQFSHREQVLTNRYIPPISTLYVYINFMLNMVEMYRSRIQKTSVIADLFKKSISISKCILDLLVQGFETEAFSNWRTLHECECVLILLNKYGEPIINEYLKHMQYGLAFRDTFIDKDQQTEIFMKMKEEMRTHDLKSKDIKKYIEYGWLYAIPEFDESTMKLNFRDGLEKIAGLEQYSKRYEMSSEIIHGTPLLIYSNREYFYFLTLLSTYESFFRLEHIFINLFAKNVSSEQFEGYKRMRSIYYTHLVNIHARESQNFSAWQKMRKRNK
ncbi:MAG: DUF5677 domain-containing protein [Bacilli bacterium]|nr:DUF5677 domain-containing protein [Bacilli bacterium]